MKIFGSGKNAVEAVLEADFAQAVVIAGFNLRLELEVQGHEGILLGMGQMDLRGQIMGDGERAFKIALGGSSAMSVKEKRRRPDSEATKEPLTSLSPDLSRGMRCGGRSPEVSSSWPSRKGRLDWRRKLISPPSSACTLLKA